MNHLQRMPPTPGRPVIWGVSAYQLGPLLRVASHDLGDRLRLELIERHFEAARDAVETRLREEPCDVVVSAGSNADYLASRLGVPVVAVRVGGHDVPAALRRARQISDRIAVLLHRTAGEEVQQFVEAFGLPVEVLSYDSPQDAHGAIRRLAERGVRVVVGAGLAVHLAEAAGLAGVFLYSLASARAALEEALRVAAERSVERSRSTLLTTVLHHLDDGVIAVDDAGRLIAANPAAERLTGWRLLPVTGQPLAAALAGLGLRMPAAATDPETGAVESIDGRTVVVDRAPLLEAGRPIGAVLTLHPPAAVERAYGSIRAHGRRRGGTAKYRLRDLVAESGSMQAVLQRCEAIARHSDATVLIAGESGTGKELIAHGIHLRSARRSQPFVAVNCGALPETLLESELFGYEEGAFTGARRRGKTGLFETAHGGTIFLDEIAELPLALQSRLLRVLQEREVTRVGAVEAVPVDLRVIAATHRALPERVRDGQFREDLYYRLDVLRVTVPPLRERPEDVDRLATVFVERALGRVGRAHLLARTLAAASPVLQRHRWPGNVRELENVAERLAIATLEHEAPLTPEQVVALLDARGRSEAAVAAPVIGLQQARGEQERAHIQQVLAACGGQQAAAARALGISRTTLWRKLRQPD